MLLSHRSLTFPALHKFLPAALVLVLAALAGCAPQPWRPHPISVSSVAAICEPGRRVYCQWGDPRCPAVQAAVEAINGAVPGLLVYAGEMPREGLLELFRDHARQVIVVATAVGVPEDPEQWRQLPIAFARLVPDARTACLPSVPIVLVWPREGLDAAAWSQVVLHEMLHSLGAAHAPGECPYSTIMHPALETEQREGLSSADKNYLVAVYGQD